MNIDNKYMLFSILRNCAHFLSNVPMLLIFIYSTLDIVIRKYEPFCVEVGVVSVTRVAVKGCGPLSYASPLYVQKTNKLYVIFVLQNLIFNMKMT